MELADKDVLKIYYKYDPYIKGRGRGKGRGNHKNA